MATRGKVKWFSESKGYGLVEKEDGGEIFVHFSEMVSTGRTALSENDKITFDSLTGPGGPNGAHVVKLMIPPPRRCRPCKSRP